MTRDPARQPFVLRASAAAARHWRWVGLGALVLIGACGAVLVPRHDGSGTSTMVLERPGADGAAPQSGARGGVESRDDGLGGAALTARSGGAGSSTDAPVDAPPTGLPFIAATDNGPEARLIGAYAAIGNNDGRTAMRMAEELVRDHPEFSLAQMLHGDLLAMRAGVASAFGMEGDAVGVLPPAAPPQPPQPGASAPTIDARLALKDEALRRIAALRERPPAGRIPAQFVEMPASQQHAIAVDASRSRLYLFENGARGLELVRDFYVSLGTLGIEKSIEGDRRTPLGVYWLTSALKESQIGPRFGKAALRFNYPNAWDRIKGRSGTGLFLHGVPTRVLTNVPWSTDGCVSMSNQDVLTLLKDLQMGTTPVVIARSLQWVAPQAVRQSAAEFRPAFHAWDEARRAADPRDLQRWYADPAAVSQDTTSDVGERTDVSFLSWDGDGVPLMMVTSRSPWKQGVAYRQYWTYTNGTWRIVFDGPVSLADAPRDPRSRPGLVARRTAREIDEGAVPPRPGVTVYPGAPAAAATAAAATAAAAGGRPARARAATVAASDSRDSRPAASARSQNSESRRSRAGEDAKLADSTPGSHRRSSGG